MAPWNIVRSITSVLLGKGQVLLVWARQQLPSRVSMKQRRLSPTAPRRACSRPGPERLKRPDEAIACYDRAIALVRFAHAGHLSKGAVFNRQERYADALACYEQALRSEGEELRLPGG